jgi:hypothetical protein
MDFTFSLAHTTVKYCGGIFSTALNLEAALAVAALRLLFILQEEFARSTPRPTLLSSVSPYTRTARPASSSPGTSTLSTASLTDQLWGDVASATSSSLKLSFFTTNRCFLSATIGCVSGLSLHPRRHCRRPRLCWKERLTLCHTTTTRVLSHQRSRTSALRCR